MLSEHSTMGRMGGGANGGMPRTSAESGKLGVTGLLPVCAETGRSSVSEALLGGAAVYRCDTVGSERRL